MILIVKRPALAKMKADAQLSKGSVFTVQMTRVNRLMSASKKENVT